MNPELFEKIENLPLFIDGSDGSMWQSRSDVATAMADPASASRHYVRLSDLLAALQEASPALSTEFGTAPIIPGGPCCDLPDPSFHEGM